MEISEMNNLCWKKDIALFMKGFIKNLRAFNVYNELRF